MAQAVNNIVLYQTPTCSMCSMVKSLMDSKNIKYSVNQDIEEMKSLGITSVPVLYVDGNKKDFIAIIDFIKNYGKE